MESTKKSVVWFAACIMAAGLLLVGACGGEDKDKDKGKAGAAQPAVAEDEPKTAAAAAVEATKKNAAAKKAPPAVEKGGNQCVIKSASVSLKMAVKGDVELSLDDPGPGCGGSYMAATKTASLRLTGQHAGGKLDVMLTLKGLDLGLASQTVEADITVANEPNSGARGQWKGKQCQIEMRALESFKDGPVTYHHFPGKMVSCPPLKPLIKGMGNSLTVAALEFVGVSMTAM